MAKLTKSADTSTETGIIDDAISGFTNVTKAFAAETADAEAKNFVSERSAGRGALAVGLGAFALGARVGDKVPFLGTKN